MNFVKKFLIGGKTKSRIETLEKVRISLLLILDLFAKL